MSNMNIASVPFRKKKGNFSVGPNSDCLTGTPANLQKLSSTSCLANLVKYWWQNFDTDFFHMCPLDTLPNEHKEHSRAHCLYVTFIESMCCPISGGVTGRWEIWGGGRLGPPKAGF